MTKIDANDINVISKKVPDHVKNKKKTTSDPIDSFGGGEGKWKARELTIEQEHLCCAQSDTDGHHNPLPFPSAKLSPIRAPQLRVNAKLRADL